MNSKTLRQDADTMRTFGFPLRADRLSAIADELDQAYFDRTELLRHRALLADLQQSARDNCNDYRYAYRLEQMLARHGFTTDPPPAPQIQETQP